MEWKKASNEMQNVFGEPCLLMPDMHFSPVLFASFISPGGGSMLGGDSSRFANKPAVLARGLLSMKPGRHCCLVGFPPGFLGPRGDKVTHQGIF